MGGSECGKTSLAIGLSLGLWKGGKIRTLAFDPWLRENPKRWGAHAWATDEFEKFRHVVFNTHGCAVIWDEGSSTGGRDRDNTPLFTAIRHNHEAIFFLGHQYSAMLPIMRGSLTDLFLFRAHADEADAWARILTDREILGASDLGQFHCIHKRAFKPAKKLTYTLDQLHAGVLPS